MPVPAFVHLEIYLEILDLMSSQNWFSVTRFSNANGMCLGVIAILYGLFACLLMHGVQAIGNAILPPLRIVKYCTVGILGKRVGLLVDHLALQVLCVSNQRTLI